MGFGLGPGTSDKTSSKDLPHGMIERHGQKNYVLVLDLLPTRCIILGKGNKL